MQRKHPEPSHLAVGRVLRPHGVHGELRVEILTDSPEHLAELDTLYVGRSHRPYHLESIRLHQKIALIKLGTCDDRNSAEELRDEYLYVATKDAVPLAVDEVYEHQVIGLTVVTDEGQTLGEVVEVFTAPGANDVFIVHGPLGEILIPAIEDVVVGLEVEARRLVIRLLPGLLLDNK
jgi:16S rRNA processing protein RimM